MFVVNSVLINAAADAMWKWEQSGRTDSTTRRKRKSRNIARGTSFPHGPAIYSSTRSK